LCGVDVGRSPRGWRGVACSDPAPVSCPKLWYAPYPAHIRQ
jgi:hypothetical protein